MLMHNIKPFFLFIYNYCKNRSNLLKKDCYFLSQLKGGVFKITFENTPAKVENRKKTVFEGIITYLRLSCRLNDNIHILFKQIFYFAEKSPSRFLIIRRSNNNRIFNSDRIFYLFFSQTFNLFKFFRYFLRNFIRFF